MLSILLALAAIQPNHDVVLAGGRVLDPETGLDAVRHVGIRDGEIVAISETPLAGTEVLDVSGLVVAPGFIDMHAHGQDEFSSTLQAQDGVTTQLELEIGVAPLGRWLALKEGKARIHYGAATSHIAARTAAKANREDVVLRGAVESVSLPRHLTHGPLDEGQTEAMLGFLERDLDAGALGIGMGIQYVPGCTGSEILEVFELAAARKTLAITHTRYIGLVGAESSMTGIQEVLANAAVTGAPLHIVHINSSSLSLVRTTIAMVEGAARNGLDVSTECYPYNAGSTSIEAAIFDDGWQDKLGISYGDLEWPQTGERLTEETFAKYREQGGDVILHMMQPEHVDYAVGHPTTIIASDGMPFINGRAHPRGAGTYARVLGKYVREENALGLMTAIRKMSYLPARRLQATVPAMARKGRVQVGCDADLTVFDPRTVRDQATFAEPARPSTGIVHVLVSGVSVVRDGELVPEARPGRAITR